MTILLLLRFISRLYFGRCNILGPFRDTWLTTGSCIARLLIREVANPEMQAKDVVEDIFKLFEGGNYHYFS